MRPIQWVKNVFVVVPLIFSKNLFNVSLFSQSFLTFLSFCMAASSIYIVNDIADRKLDTVHPVKKKRPIASGEVSAGAGLATSVALMIISFLLLSLGKVSLGSWLAISAYVVVNLFYSFALKKVVLIDVFVIAVGFILRILAGGYAIDVKISSWLIMTTLFIAIFLGIAKRRGEFVQMEGSSSEMARKVLADYDLSLIDQILSVSAASVIIAYALYTVSERTVHAFGTEALIFTTIFVVYGIFRYLFLIHKMGLGENPTGVILADKPMIINIVFYVISLVAIIYKRELFHIISKYVPLS
ncbi:MAG: decaprenyl-phosphate phosphoribosyltransferase [Bacteroidetes bacterium]|nr:decaprenyl-phosphate phosphoribosyltransferase [Bacteroidota bacterium]